MSVGCLKYWRARELAAALVVGDPRADLYAMRFDGGQDNVIRRGGAMTLRDTAGAKIAGKQPAIKDSGGRPPEDCVALTARNKEMREMIDESRDFRATLSPVQTVCGDRGGL